MSEITTAAEHREVSGVPGVQKKSGILFGLQKTVSQWECITVLTK